LFEDPKILPREPQELFWYLLRSSFTDKSFLGRIEERSLIMKRGRQKNPREYIEIRITQLLEDRNKEKDSFNRQWLWRVISELKYVATMMDRGKEDKK